MKLNEEQQQMVAENHNLIYWYINKKKLDEDEWYDLLAIELCISTIKYDKSRGSFSNYFKLRCDNMMYNEYLKNTSKKRSSNGTTSLDDSYTICDEKALVELCSIDELLKTDATGILQLRVEGYTQSEISTKLGVSQPYVSQVLSRMKKLYNEEFRND